MAEPGGEQEPPETPRGPKEADLRKALRELARSGRAPEIDHLRSTPDLAREERAQDIGLRGQYGKVLLWMMGIQIAIANGVFITYAWAGRDWDIETGVIQAWLAATVVQIVGVVAVVTRYLFPRRDDQP